MVAPARIAFAISSHPGVTLSRLKNPHPEGVLRIKIVRAINLEAKDWQWGVRTSDPFVEVKVGADVWRTQTIQNTCNPVWTEGNVHDIFIASTDQIVRIDIYDYDKYETSNDHLGSIKHLTA